jgi:phosphomevalonate kinase
MTVTARAPGKVFLTGEYAVLAGAPALVAAVDRWVECRVAPADGGAGAVVESLAEQHRTSLAEQRDGDVGAVVAALRAVGARGQGVEVVVDSRSFLSDGRKLGLGRSAATLTAAVAALLDDDDPARVLACALAANTSFQDGRGSGADVAAAVHGGVLEIRRAGADLRLAARALPAGLELLVGWTGESASTVPLLERFDAARPTGALAELAATAEDAATAAARGDAAALVAAVDRTGDQLERLGREAGIPIVTPALSRLVAAARREGAAAKPSGAGGGDCGIALVDSPARGDAVRAAWRAAGIVPLTLAIAPHGVHCTRGAESEVRVG